VPCGPHGGASFLFVSDLTNKATGIVLIVLIILYIGTQLASSLMMSSATMDPTQRKIMLFMPLFFVLFVINFPAGVIVYWITTNSWTILQQYVVKKRIGPVRAPPADTTGAATTSVVSTGRGSTRREAEAERKPAARPSGNGSGGTSGAGGLAGLLRGRTKAAAPAAVGTATRSGPPPRPPRKKKKRSGRRR